MDFIFLWQCHGSYTSHNREGEGGARAVSSGGGWLAFCSHGCSHLCLRGDPFMGENAHGMPFEAIPLAPSHVVGEQKRKSCGATSERKSADSRIFGEKGRCVARPQHERCRLADFWWKRKRCGATSLPFSTTWRKRKVGGANSAAKSADSRIFGEKGSRVARPPCHFPQLGEKGRWVAQPQQGKVPTRGFSAKKETVWRDLKNLPNILYFFVYQHRLNDPWMLTWGMSIGNDGWV